MGMDEISHLLKLLGDALPDLEIKKDEPMNKHTTFNIGGPVRAMLFPNNEDRVIKLCKLCHETGVAPLIMGNGSNMLVTGKGLDRVVINTTKLNNISLTEAVGEDLPTHHGTANENPIYIKAEAGAMLATIAVVALESELTGFEFAHGIPGSIGGAVVMNAGAYGGEMKDVTHITTAYGQKAGLYETVGNEHGFSYRHSRFLQIDDVIISTVVKLQKGNKEDIRQKMDELSAKRSASQPLDRQSAGSTFKRPESGYAAELIDRAGLRGCAIGAAEVSSKHAGFIINKGGATFEDTMKLIDHVRETVFKEFGVVLEPEIKIFS